MHAKGEIGTVVPPARKLAKKIELQLARISLENR